LLPLSLGGERLGVRRDPPRLGQDSVAVLTGLGFDAETAARLSAVNDTKSH
jgi:crotonobetainyl-CoA:carnitine CoA-transferase CaiB-like acyl-CoA transferase